MPYRKRDDAKFLVDGETGCWVWQWGLSKSGYGQEWSPEHRRPFPAHRMAFARAKGPIPEGAFICHTCDNKLCVNPDHLYAGDAKTNAQDKVDRGRSAPTAGESNGNAILTAGQVAEIRAAYTGRRGQQKELAELFGISAAQVHCIIRHKSWAA